MANECKNCVAPAFDHLNGKPPAACTGFAPTPEYALALAIGAAHERIAEREKEEQRREELEIESKAVESSARLRQQLLSVFGGSEFAPFDLGRIVQEGDHAILEFDYRGHRFSLAYRSGRHSRCFVVGVIRHGVKLEDVSEDGFQFKVVDIFENDMESTRDSLLAAIDSIADTEETPARTPSGPPPLRHPWDVRRCSAAKLEEHLAILEGNCYVVEHIFQVPDTDGGMDGYDVIAHVTRENLRNRDVRPQGK